MTKLTPAGNALVYSTYLGGSGDDRARDRGGRGRLGLRHGVHPFDQLPTQSAVPGDIRRLTTPFVAKLMPAGNALVYSTYLGGSDYDTARDRGGRGGLGLRHGVHQFDQLPHPVGVPGDIPRSRGRLRDETDAGGQRAGLLHLPGWKRLRFGYGIAVDAAGSAYVTGTPIRPTSPPSRRTRRHSRGNEDAFVTKLTPAGNALVYSTYLGGSGDDYGYGIAVDAAGSAYVTGSTGSTNFPTQSPYQATFQGSNDAFVTKLTPAGNALVYSTYLGGSGDDCGLRDRGGRGGLGLRHGVHRFDQLPHPVAVPGDIPWDLPTRS